MTPFKVSAKRALLALVILLAALIFVTAVLSGCSGFNQVESSSSSKLVDATGGGDGEEEEGSDCFTVTVVCEDEIDFTRNIIYARWTNETSYYEARVSADGVATGAASMDGDFKVTLDGVPSGYLYNPNIYTADNDNKSTEVEILKLTKLRDSSGTNGPYSRITINTTGAFVYTFESSSKYYFELKCSMGYYAFESWANVEENTVNPILYMYSSSGSFVNVDYPSATVNDGSAGGTFTKNFYYELNFDTNSGQYIFAIAVDISTNISYPVDLYFSIVYLGATSAYGDTELILPNFNSTMTTDSDGNVIADSDGYYRNENAGYAKLQNLTSNDYSANKESGKGFGSIAHFNISSDYKSITYDSSVYYLHGNVAVGYNAEKKEYTYANLVGLNTDEGVYRMYNPSTGKYDGAYIYTYINCSGEALINIDNFDTENNLSIKITDWGYDYKLFLQGYDRLATDRGDGYGAYSLCKSYYDLKNEDGLCLVTAELQEFLEYKMRGAGFFKDGDGSYESTDNSTGYKWSADDSAIWLLACCAYYDN